MYVIIIYMIYNFQGMFSAGPKPNHDQFLLQFMEYMFSKTRSFEVNKTQAYETCSSTNTICGFSYVILYGKFF